MVIPELESNFDFSEEDNAAERQLNLLEEEKIKILNIIKEQAEKTISDIQLKLPSEEKKDFMIISRYVSKIIDINEVSKNAELTEDEMIKFIQEIDNSVSEKATLEDIDYKYTTDDEDVDTLSLLNPSKKDEKNDDEDTSGSLDF